MNALSTLSLAGFQDNAGEAARLLKALSNEKRLMILCQLGDGERAVGDLLPAAGLSQSALSQHLAVLREEGLVAGRREGLEELERRIREAHELARRRHAGCGRGRDCGSGEFGHAGNP